MANERRHADRAAVQLNGLARKGATEYEIIVSNLGPAGAFIETADVLKVGERIELAFPLLPFRSQLIIQAEVRWKRGSDPNDKNDKGGVGVHFRNVRELDQLAIHDYVLILLAKRRHRQYEH